MDFTVFAPPYAIRGLKDQGAVNGQLFQSGNFQTVIFIFRDSIDEILVRVVATCTC
jgi:hypothetical protein